MRVNPESTALALLLAMLMATISVSVDATLPALPLLLAEFDAGSNEVLFTLTAFFLGYAAAQLVCGPLADRFGRRPVLLWGLTLHAAASLGCASAGSLASLAGWRFLMGLACVVGPVLARAIVRDLHAGEHAARLMARVMTLFGVAPILAPLAGGALLAAGGWRAIYVGIALATMVLVAVIAASLPETAPRAARGSSVSPVRFVRNFGTLLAHPGYRSALLVGCAAQAGIFAFVTNASLVSVQVLELTPGQFSALFAFVMLGHIAGAQAGSRLVMRRGINAMLRLGAALSFAGGMLLAACSFAGLENAWSVAIPMLLYLAGAGIVIPCVSAAALTPFPSMAGAASSLQLFIQTLIGAALGLAVTAAADASTRPIAAAIGLCSLALFAFERLHHARRVRAPVRHGAS
ncbi:MAG: multidrug effflux MFS transporter [Burkholderiales bacterium]|nr:multidrug effflux MFS transporter [Burkholderiales bacterium]